MSFRQPDSTILAGLLPQHETATPTPADLVLTIAEYDGQADNRPKPQEVPWPDLALRLQHHDERATKDGPAWSPATYPKDRHRSSYPATTAKGEPHPKADLAHPWPWRNNVNVGELVAAVADLEHGADLNAIRERLAEFECVIHTTFSHAGNTPHLRIVVPFARPVEAADWAATWERLNAALFCGSNDPQTRDAARIYFGPSCKPGAERFAEHHEGRLLDPSELSSRPAASPNGTTAAADGEPSRGEVDYLGYPTLTFLALGADVGRQRGEALAATRALLASGKTVEETAELVWQGLQRSKCGDPSKPWTREHALELARDLARRPAPPLPRVPILEPATEDVSESPERDRVRRRSDAGASLSIVPWPEPLDKAAYHGLTGEIVRAIEPHTEADPIAILAQLVVMFGSVVHRSPHFIAEADRHGLNEFMVLVGETAKARKGSSYGQVRRCYESVDPDWSKKRVQSGISSGEGLIWAVRDAIYKSVYDKTTKETELVLEDPGIDDKRLLVFEAEFANVLRVLTRDGNTASVQIRNAWDHGNLQAMTKNSPAQATEAHISIIGHITKDELRRYLDATEAGNGFGNRILWLAVRRSKSLPEGGRLNDAEMKPLIERLRAAVDFARTCAEMRLDEEARATWYDVYPALSEGKPGLLGAMIARAEAHVRRLACIYALLDQSRSVRQEHLVAALAFWQYAEDSAKWIFGEALGDPIADAILRELRASPEGMTGTEIHNLFGRNARAGQIARALQSLAEKGLVRHERKQGEKGGRPTD